MPAPHPSTPAARSSRLAAVRSEIQAVTRQRLAMPGGMRDGILRGRLEALQAEEDRLCRELGLPVRHAEPRAFGWPGWMLLVLAITTVVVVIYLVN
ncbi:hypothetical protein QL996_09335 [Planococcus sp. APC 4015]|nr:hypothetical protein [Planococcus sp. APC 4015]